MNGIGDQSPCIRGIVGALRGGGLAGRMTRVRLVYHPGTTGGATLARDRWGSMATMTRSAPDAHGRVSAEAPDRRRRAGIRRSVEQPEDAPSARVVGGGR